MSSVNFTDIRVLTAAQFKEAASEPTPNTKIYLTFGRSNPWANDAVPDTANTTQSTRYDVWRNMIGGKRVTSNDMRHVVPRYNWTSGTSYVAYDDKNPTLLNGTTQFYVLTSDYNVYKCIANNYSSNSTTEPTSTSTTNTSETADGYIWKFMYSLTDEDKLRFLTTDYMPVKTLAVNDGSLQWGVQNNTTSGAISSIIVTNNGSGYSNANSVTVSITGNGSDATATANVNVTSQQVESITLTSAGDGYTNTNITISDASGGGTQAQARAIISPFGGHGSNPLYELGGTNLILNMKYKFDESGKFQTTNEYRQVAMIANPYAYGTNDVYDSPTFNQSFIINTTGTGDYLEDEWVYQGGSLLTSTFRGQVLSWDSATGKVYTINNTGTPDAQSLIGYSSAIGRFVSSTVIEELEKNTGRFLYLDNIVPITRNPNQQEDFKIILKF